MGSAWGNRKQWEVHPICKLHSGWVRALSTRLAHFLISYSCYIFALGLHCRHKPACKVIKICIIQERLLKAKVLLAKVPTSCR